MGRLYGPTGSYVTTNSSGNKNKNKTEMSLSKISLSEMGKKKCCPVKQKNSSVDGKMCCLLENGNLKNEKVCCVA